MKKLISSWWAIFAAFLPVVTLAQTQNSLPAPQPSIPQAPRDIGGLLNLIERVASYAFGFLLVGAFIMFMIGAFQYLFGGASSTAKDNAKNYLIYGAIAVIVGFAAFAIAQTLKTVVTGV